MKKHLLSLALVTAGAVHVMAQPTLTSSNIAPAVGQSFTTHTAGYVSPGNSGANQVWNLAFTPSTGNTSTFVAPSSTPNGSSFPNSNVAMNSGANTAYYKATSTEFQVAGFYGNGTVISYYNNEDMLRFPFSYNSSYTDTWGTTFVNGVTFYRTGSTTVTYDGYGTLTTPGGTFQNVVRTHFVQTYQDSSSFGIITYTNDEYMWWLPGYSFVIATVGTLTSSFGSPTQYGQYDSNVSVGTAEIGSPQLLDVFPVPANEKLTLNVGNAEAVTEVKIFSVTGAEVKSISAEKLFVEQNVAEIPVFDLPQGVYFLQVRKGNAMNTRKIVISR